MYYSHQSVSSRKTFIFKLVLSWLGSFKLSYLYLHCFFLPYSRRIWKLHRLNTFTLFWSFTWNEFTQEIRFSFYFEIHIKYCFVCLVVFVHSSCIWTTPGFTCKQTTSLAFRWVGGTAVFSAQSSQLKTFSVIIFSRHKVSWHWFFAVIIYSSKINRPLKELQGFYLSYWTIENSQYCSSRCHQFQYPEKE